MVSLLWSCTTANGFLFIHAECDQNKERMLEVLDGRSLGFLVPLMKLEKELLNQLKKDSSPQCIYKWIRDNISLKLHTDPAFVNILITRYNHRQTKL